MGNKSSKVKENFITGYTQGNVIGKGSFGTLYEATRKSDNETFAVKVVSKNKVTKVVDSTKKECHVMLTLSHPNILKVYEFSEDEVNYYCVMELYNNTLFDIVSDHGHFSENKAFFVYKQLLDALEYLHDEKNIIHRDVKLENILTNYTYGSKKDIKIVLADFGFYVNQKPDDPPIENYSGSIVYSAPEMLVVHPKYEGRSVDVWAANICLYILLTGEYPWYSDYNPKLAKMIKNDDYILPLDKVTLSDDTITFIKWILDKNPSTRPTIKQIKKDKHFNYMLTSYKIEKNLNTKRVSFDTLQ